MRAGRGTGSLASKATPVLVDAEVGQQAGHHHPATASDPPEDAVPEVVGEPTEARGEHHQDEEHADARREQLGER